MNPHPGYPWLGVLFANGGIDRLRTGTSIRDVTQKGVSERSKALNRIGPNAGLVAIALVFIGMLVWMWFTYS